MLNKIISFKCTVLEAVICVSQRVRVPCPQLVVTLFITVLQ